MRRHVERRGQRLPGIEPEKPWTMKIPHLPAIRWFRIASKGLPMPQAQGQSVPERCREKFAGEVQWFLDLLVKARARKG
jgi:hypothetical protein